MNDYLRPSGFIGAAMGIQGIRDATVVLHGQNGCRKGLLSSQKSMIRTKERENRFYGAENAIPYSNIRPEDYYNNTVPKLEEVMEHVSGEEYSLKVLMCSPGISMIGDDCKRYCSKDSETMLLNTDFLSNSVSKGFDECMHDVVDFLSPNQGERIDNGVNLIGLSIMHKDWYSYCHEFSHLLKDAGFKINCVLGAGCMVQDIRDSVNASYNIIVDPAYSERTAEMYKDRYGIESISIGRCPIGFDSIDSLFERIEDVTGTELAHGRSMVKKSKKRAYEGIISSGKCLRGRTFDVMAEETTSLPLSEFLESSFCMVRSTDTPDYLFAPGDIALLEDREGRCGKGIDIGFPSSYGSEFLKKPLMGLEGTMYILDALFNRCGDRIHLRATSFPDYDLCGYPCL